MAMKDVVPIDAYVLDVLMRDLIGHDRRPASLVVYLAVLRAAEQGRVTLSHQQLADRTGLSKRTVQAALAHLVQRRLVAAERRGPTEPALLTPLAPWRR